MGAGRHSDDHTLSDEFSPQAVAELVWRIDHPSEGQKKLHDVSARLTKGERVEAITTRELLQWFGAEYRGPTINNEIRDALYVADLQVEPDLVQGDLDTVLSFQSGRIFDEIEARFVAQGKRTRVGTPMTTADADLLHKLHHQRIVDLIVGWLDRNPSSRGKQEEVQAKADYLAQLGLDEFWGLESLDIIDFPSPNLHVGPRHFDNDDRPAQFSGANSIRTIERSLTLYWRGHIPKEQLAKERRRLNDLEAALGSFLIRFSHLEFHIRETLRIALRLSENTFEIIASQYDVSSLLLIAKKIICEMPNLGKAELQEIKDVLADCEKIRDARNKIAHGTWFVDGENLGAEVLSKQKISRRIAFEDVEEITDMIAKIETCKQRLSKIMNGSLRRFRNEN